MASTCQWDVSKYFDNFDVCCCWDLFFVISAGKLIKGFHDESLQGEWKGFRSSRLGRQYRVIYQIHQDQVLVQVVRISPPDYRKK